MKTKILGILLFISTGFIACKKDSTPAQTKTTQEKILGKWNLVTTVTNDFYGGTSHISTDTWTGGEYIDFRNDGKAYGYNSGGYDTTAYGIIGDSKLWIGTSSDQLDIKLLTETDMQLYIKYIYASWYSESTVTLNR